MIPLVSALQFQIAPEVRASTSLAPEEPISSAAQVAIEAAGQIDGGSSSLVGRVALQGIPLEDPTPNLQALGLLAACIALFEASQSGGSSPPLPWSAQIVPSLDPPISFEDPPINFQEIAHPVLQNGLELAHFGRELQSQPNIVRAAVTQNGLALKYASKALQNERRIVRAAVRQNGLALKYASNVLQNDSEIVLAAVMQNGLALKYASPILQNNPEIVRETIKQNVWAFKYASPTLQRDRDIVLAAIQKDRYIIASFPRELQIDPHIIRAAIQRCGLALQYASEEQQNDPRLVLAAIEESASAIEFASPAIQNDPVFLRDAAEKNGLILGFIPTALKTLDICCAAVIQNLRARRSLPDIYKNLSIEQMDNPSFFPLIPESEKTLVRVLAAIKHNPLYLGCVSAEFRAMLPENDLIFVVAQNPKAMQWLPDIYKNLTPEQKDNPLFFPLLTHEEKTFERAHAALKHNPLYLHCICAEFQAMMPQEDLISAVRKKPEALKLINRSLLKAVVVAALVYVNDKWNTAATDNNIARKVELKNLADSLMSEEYSESKEEIIYVLATYFNDDHEFMVFAITRYGVGLDLASERLRHILG
jgi:hypothetical protein